MSANNQHIKEGFFWIFLISAFIFISRTVNVQGYGDDSFFKSMYHSGKVISEIVNRYTFWSGRLVIDSLTMLTIGKSFFWRLAIPSSILLTVYVVWASFLSGKIKYFSGIPLVFLTFMMITPSVMENSLWWVTGFYNYMLPFSLASFAYYVYCKGSDRNKIMAYLSIASAFIACFSEQVAIMLTVGALITIICKDKRELYHYLFIATCIIASCILFLSPGNASRFAAELNFSMPEFTSANLIMKITYGVDRLNSHTSDRSNLIFIFCSILVLFSTFKLRTVRAFDLIPCGIIILKSFIVFYSNNNTDIVTILNNTSRITANIWSGHGIYSSYMMTMLTCSSFIYLVSMIFDGKKMIFASLLSIYSFASVVMIGFSPTVYESGQRVLFVNDACLFAIACAIIGELIKEKSP